MAYFGAGTKCRSPPDIMGGGALRLAAADKVIDLLASCGRPVGWHLAAGHPVGDNACTMKNSYR